ncbi:hypothetical protein [Thermococcus gorgonarius]|uniref:hypothetical protein n=1 Tax=Thermococcus gorgonarius TaxID=71997 RepID=UPI0018DF8060|nr:hypothetical protein [Thermococcus gorgonarius]
MVEAKADSHKREVSKTPIHPITIDDLYERMKALVGEVKEDPHRILREMRNARG